MKCSLLALLLIPALAGAVDCDSADDLRKARATQICLKSESCKLERSEVEFLLEFKEQCAALGSIKSNQESCWVRNPITWSWFEDPDCLARKAGED